MFKIFQVNIVQLLTLLFSDFRPVTIIFLFSNYFTIIAKKLYFYPKNVTFLLADQFDLFLLINFQQFIVRFLLVYIFTIFFDHLEN